MGALSYAVDITCSISLHSILSSYIVYLKNVRHLHKKCMEIVFNAAKPYLELLTSDIMVHLTNY